MSTTVSVPDTADYSYRVTWSGEDEEFVATCLELPSLSWLAASREEALHGLHVLVAGVVDDLVANGEPVPLAPQSRVIAKPGAAS